MMENRQKRPAPRRRKKAAPRKKHLRFHGWLFLLLVTVFDELLLHRWVVHDGSFPRFLAVLLFALSCGALLGFIVSLLPPRQGKYAAVGISLIQAVLYMMEYFLHDSFQTFMPLSVVAAGAGGVATDFSGTVFSLMAANWWRIGLILLPIGFYGFCVRAKRKRKLTSAKLALLTVVLYAVTLLVVALIPGYRDGLTTAFSFDSAVRDYGLNVALALDVTKDGDVGFNDLEDPPVDDPTVPPATSGGEQTSDPTAPTEPPVVYVPQILPIDFAALAEGESNADVAKLHSYVNSLTPSMTNDYTGLFEGKNLILITAEAFTGAWLSPELTPTLWRLANEGIQFTEYYQPLWAAGTTGGEYSNVVGLVPGSGQCMKETYQQDLFLTIGNQLQAQGYHSAAYHNNSHTYYDRHETHKLLGYDEFIGMGNGMEEGVRDVWPQSDQEMFDFTIPKHLGEQPFSLYYMTVSGHSAYSKGGNAMSRKNYDAVAHLDCSETLKCYIAAANMELEYAMASLVRQLEEAGIADDTVIVIGSDHYPYGLDESDTWGTNESYLSELFGEECDNRFVRDQNTLIIWSGCIEDMDIVVDTPVSSLDILPTLSNLFGVEYDSRLLIGRDVFSDATPLVFWPDHSWVTDRGVYNSSTRKFTSSDGLGISDSYISNISAQVSNKLTYSNAIQTTDYFNYVAEAME